MGLRSLPGEGLSEIQDARNDQEDARERSTQGEKAGRPRASRSAYWRR